MQRPFGSGEGVMRFELLLCLCALPTACARSHESPEQLARAAIAATRDVDAAALKSLLLPVSEMAACFGPRGADEGPKLEREIESSVQRAREKGAWSTGGMLRSGRGSVSRLEDAPKLKDLGEAGSEFAAIVESMQRGCHVSSPHLRVAPDCTWQLARNRAQGCGVVGWGKDIRVPVTFDGGRNGFVSLSMGLAGGKWYLMSVPHPMVFVEHL